MRPARFRGESSREHKKCESKVKEIEKRECNGLHAISQGTGRGSKKLLTKITRMSEVMSWEINENEWHERWRKKRKNANEIYTFVSTVNSFIWVKVNWKKEEREEKKEKERTRRGRRISQLSSSLSEQMYARRKWKSDFKMICVPLLSASWTYTHRKWMRYSLSLSSLLSSWSGDNGVTISLLSASHRVSGKTFFLPLFLAVLSSAIMRVISPMVSLKSAHTQANKKTASWSQETPFFHSLALSSLSLSPATLFTAVSLLLHIRNNL